MRIEHRLLATIDDGRMPTGFIVRQRDGTTKMVAEYQQVKWLLDTPQLRDRYTVVRHGYPTLTRFVYEEHKNV